MKISIVVLVIGFLAICDHFATSTASDVVYSTRPEKNSLELVRRLSRSPLPSHTNLDTNLESEDDIVRQKREPWGHYGHHGYGGHGGYGGYGGGYGGYGGGGYGGYGGYGIYGKK